MIKFVTPLGSTILSVGQEGVLVRWQYKTHHQQFLPRLGAPIYHVAVSQDDSLAAISQKDNGMFTVCEYEHTTGTETAFLLHEVRTRISCKRVFGTFIREGGWGEREQGRPGLQVFSVLNKFLPTHRFQFFFFFFFFFGGGGGVGGCPAPFATSYMIGQEDKRTNYRTMFPALKTNAGADYKDAFERCRSTDFFRCKKLVGTLLSFMG